jgi:HemY protein
LSHATAEALDTTRLLAKHHAFSKDVAPSLIKSLVLKQIDDARDTAQLQAIWRGLDTNDRLQADISIHAAFKLNILQGQVHQMTDWLLPVWNVLTSLEGGLNNIDNARYIELIQTLEAILAQQMQAKDTAWLARIEKAQLANPRDPRLQYLAGIACKSHQLWGKAQQQLSQAASQLKDTNLKRRSWCALAELAEQRGDAVAAGVAWKNAAQI